MSPELGAHPAHEDPSPPTTAGLQIQQLFKVLFRFSGVGATDLRELWSDLDFLNEAFQEVGDAGPGVDAVGSIQNDDDVQLLRAL